ncbi:MAG: hypothetical protein O3B70_02010 [Bacteroidetes bacterium]|nr:hypothetical protein [Bacteroidota bacterium]MDA0903085.1 hypothetical protein [Bacteroidota bacterium]MDA1241705.1 hypothetical protein [Bacteroidota bacterium]
MRRQLLTSRTLRPQRQILMQGFMASMCLAGLVSLLGWTANHNFHFSRTDIHWRESSHTLQTTIRVFTDDLEQSLDDFRSPNRSKSSSLESLVPLRLGDEREWVHADSLLFAWVKMNLNCASEGTPIHWHWIGKEVELDVTYIHVESQRLPRQPFHWFIENKAMMDLFEDQVNEVHVHAMCESHEVQKREVLDINMPATTWAPCPTTRREKHPSP